MPPSSVALSCLGCLHISAGRPPDLEDLTQGPTWAPPGALYRGEMLLLGTAPHSPNANYHTHSTEPQPMLNYTLATWTLQWLLNGGPLLLVCVCECACVWVFI